MLGQADDVWKWCERAEMFGRTVTVKIKYADFKIATRSRTLTELVESRALLHATALDLIRSAYPPRMGIRLLGVTVSNFPNDSGNEIAVPKAEQLSFLL